MNIVNVRYGAVDQAIKVKQHLANQTRPVNNNTPQSAPVKGDLQTSAPLNKPNKYNTSSPALNDTQLKEKSALLSSFEQTITKKPQLSNETLFIKNQTAVASYQLIDNMDKRASVQQMLGIDLFA